MQRDPLTGAESYTKQNNRRRIWQKIVGGLACVVVFWTTYALILPAITMEREAYCGYEEHTHDVSCYTQTSVRKTLVCTPESLGVHKHDKTCYDGSGNLICEIPDRVVHTHNALCYDEVGQLVCQFPEVAQHEHTEACYAPAETQPAVLHVHTEECNGLEQGDLVCELEEKEGHTHGDACYTSELTCTLEVKEGHAHSSGCYTVGEALTCTIEENHTHGDGCYTSSVTCGKEEGEDHTHDGSCYTSTLSCTIPEGHVHSASCHEQVLTCELPVEPGHAHTESCYVRTLTCELPQEEGHTHTEACYTWNTVTVCGLEEGEEEPVPETEPVLICEEPVLDTHTHSEEKCFETVVDNSLTCTLEENEEHTHSDLCYGTWELTCGLEEHTHELICYSNEEADVETEEDWLATFADVELTGIWAEDVLLIAESQLGYTESVENYVVWEDGTTHGYTRYGEWYGIPHGDWCGMFVSFCLNYAGVEGMPFDFGCRTWIATLSEEEYDLYHVAEEHDPQPGELIFFDWEGDDLSDHVGLVAEIIEATDTEPAMIKTIEGNSSNKVQYVTYELDSDVILGYAELPKQLTEAEQAEVDYVIQLIDEMPSADEIDAKIEEFEEAEDYEGEEAWLTKVYRQVSAVYAEYDKLSDTQKAYVTNADKLLELEYIWSMTTYAATNTIPVYQINSYYPTGNTDPSGYAVIMLRGGSFDELCQEDGMLDFPFNYWDAIVVEEDENGNLYIAEYDTSTEDKSTYKASTANGFVLIFTNDSTHSFYLSDLNIKVGDYVSVDFAYTSYYDSNKAKYNDTTGEPYGYVTFSTETVVEGDNKVTVAQSASTSDFIELNLYDYYGDASAAAARKSTVNSLWKTSAGVYTGYPGFQWNGGAYAYIRTPSNSQLPNYTNLVDRNVVDNIDFGNSKITDYDFKAGSYGDKSASAQTVGYGNSDERGVINRIIYYPYNPEWGITNRPIGMSTLRDAGGNTFSEVLERTLNDDGYPQLASGTYTTGEGSLEYLFSESNYATKINGSSIDGLFQYDENTGAYYYNSRNNHAQYNSSTNTFTLYNQIITPNFILYPFGNFLPFNDITDGNTASLVGRITVDGKDYGYNYSGGGAAYITKIMGRLVRDNYSYTTYDYTTDEQLYNMLEEYKTNWSKYSYNGTYWGQTKTSTMINDFFNNQATAGEAPNPSGGTVDFDSGTLNDLINKMYNIDFDVEKNFFFGMDMKMNFYQPKDGMTGKDKDNDGDFDYPMEFYFTGDDDVWVYIDNILFLDLSGIHRHVGGKIDFVNGRVYYQYLDIGSGGDVSEGTTYTPYGAEEGDYYTFAEILKAGGIAEADLGNYLKKDASGKYTTFLDYSTHSFKFYYMERGSGSSVCRLNFNFPLIQQNTITVEKQLESDEEVLGNPDFTFQIVDEETGEPFISTHDEVKKWAYSLYEGDNAIQKVHIINKNPDGSIKTLEVYQQNLLLMREESGVVTHYNDDGSVRDDGTPNPKLLTTDENSCFTLKAGQKVEFVGVAESWGEYYVRELLSNTILEQYESISVSGITAVQQNDVTIGGSTFVGENSTVHNSNASNTFTFVNKINTTKLGSLSISKTIEGTVDTGKEFEFNVTIDGEPLPVGTSYTVGSTTKTVEIAGIIKLKHGETATISKILAGSKFEVTETSDSAEGYTVTYSDGSNTENAVSATGTIGVNATAKVKVTNSTNGASVDIPVTKAYVQFATGGETKRTSYFNLVQVKDATGKEIADGATVSDASITFVNEGPVTNLNLFTVSYVKDHVNFGEGNTAVFYYRLTEDNTRVPSYTAKNYQVFVYEVTVTKTGNGIQAEITGMWTGIADENGVPTGDLTKQDNVSTATFTNSITRVLTVTKTVSGGTTEDQSKDFEFTLKLEKGVATNGTVYEIGDLPGTLVGQKLKADGTTENVSYPLENGVYTFTLKHGESITFTNIPYRSKWTVTEKVDEFITTYSLGGAEPVESNTVTTNVASSTKTTVEFINTRLYTLPETGGTGTHLYTMAGLMLMLFSGAFLLYRTKRRRREAC